jgi:hypothetical protein
MLTCKFANKVLLCGVSHAIIGCSKHFQDDSVNFKFNGLSLSHAHVPDHVDLALLDFFFVKQESYKVLRSVHKLVVSVLTKNLVDDAQVSQNGNQL